MMKRVALVTGVASGIGLACAKKLLSSGVAAVGMSRRAQMAKELGESFTYVSGDVSSKEDRDRFVNTTLDKFDHIDILVNAAGVADKVQCRKLTEKGCSFRWRDVRPVPENSDFFENIWRTYRENKNIF